jgi:hypothetical protein
MTFNLSRSMSSLPRPTSPLSPTSTRRARSLLPIPAPEKPAYLPTLPCRPRPSTFTSTWARSTHLIPSTLPRTIADVPCPSGSQDSASDRNSWVDITLERVLHTRREHEDHPPSELERSHKPLWNCINHYVNQSKGAGKPLTLFLAHPNGLPKEVSCL